MTKYLFSIIPFVGLMALGAVLILFSASVWSSEGGMALNIPFAVSGTLLLLTGAIAVVFLRLRR